ncbi:MAG: imidazole glycerol phosphate synthase subunit HisH [Dehalococcoidia bacterium]|nr:imidazole glycerol phosphate synthase subunit HisH [Dehalococcoidia bacterium]
MAEIVIADYGAGNLRSVINALRFLGHESEISCDPQRVKAAAVVILPGVGAASAAMRELHRLNLADAMRFRAQQGLPLIGVCLGLQLLMSATEEGGMTPCLDIVPGVVRKLPSSAKIPHMGWNKVRQMREHKVFQDITEGAHCYFVHSYYVVPQDDSVVIGRTGYGVDFCSILACGSVIAAQFHPEKSADVGLRFYDNLIKLAFGGCLC